MKVIRFEIIPENKKLNNFISSKIGSLYPLVYESGFYVVIKDENDVIIGLTKNYIFNYIEDVYIFKDSKFKDIEDISGIVNEYALQFGIWIEDDYRNEGLGKLLLKRTITEFQAFNKKKFRTSLRETSSLHKSGFYEKEYNVLDIEKYEKELDDGIYKFTLVEGTI